MGNWQLEVFKMGLYIAFPVSMFYVFNHPPLYESLMMGAREAMYPPKDPKVEKQLMEQLEKMERKQEKKWLAQQAKLEQAEQQAKQS